MFCARVAVSHSLPIPISVTFFSLSFGSSVFAVPDYPAFLNQAHDSLLTLVDVLILLLSLCACAFVLVTCRFGSFTADEEAAFSSAVKYFIIARHKHRHGRTQ